MLNLPYTDINQFWFQGCESNPEALALAAKRWFAGGDQLDTQIREKFGHLYQPIAASLDTQPLHGLTAQQGLALILLFDQYSRNCFRKLSEAFTYDDYALQLLDYILEQKLQHDLHPIQQAFLFMPLQHAESRARQAQGVDAYAKLALQAEEPYCSYVQGSLKYAREHRDLIEQFGRFPHRNEVLGRKSTQAELEYLSSGGKRFGQ